jgi:hypothetical protein
MQVSDDQACEAEREAEARARRRLLALAERQHWPDAMVRTLDGWLTITGGRRVWEECACLWCPASVVTVLHSLYVRDGAGN